MIDLESLKIKVDLLALAGQDTNLKKVASSGGGEWAGPCPFCGGQDRFRVQPYEKPGRWLCRYCTDGKWRDVLDYVARRDNLDLHKREDLKAACQALGAGDLLSIITRKETPSTPAYAPPAPDWQAASHQVISECESALWNPKNSKVLDYLRGRGLQDETIKHFRLGYCATGEKDVFGRKIAGLWVPRGIVIPCIVAGVIWYLKIRLVPGLPCKCQNKDCGAIMDNPGRCASCGEDNRYRGVKGNRTATIFNADALDNFPERFLTSVIFCEGEFDAILAHQELGEVVPIVSFGSNTNLPDLATWGAYLLPIRTALIAYDADQAGQNGGLRVHELLGDRAKLAFLPPGPWKDIADFHKAGGDLLDWCISLLRFYVSLEKEATTL